MSLPFWSLKSITVAALVPGPATRAKRDNWEGGPWDRAIQARSLAGLGRKAEQKRRTDEHF